MKSASIRRKERVNSPAASSALKSQGEEGRLPGFSSRGAANPPSFRILQRWRETKKVQRTGRTVTCKPKDRSRVSWLISSPPRRKLFSDEPNPGEYPARFEPTRTAQ